MKLKRFNENMALDVNGVEEILGTNISTPVPLSDILGEGMVLFTFEDGSELAADINSDYGITPLYEGDGEIDDIKKFGEDRSKELKMLKASDHIYDNIVSIKFASA